MTELTIPRAVLLEIVEKAIFAGRGTLRHFLKGDRTLEQFKLDSIRDAMRTCVGVDFGAFDCQYGCPITQAGLRGMYGFWFSMTFDRLMHSHLEVPHSLESGWGVRVTDDLP